MLRAIGSSLAVLTLTFAASSPVLAAPEPVKVSIQRQVIFQNPGELTAVVDLTCVASPTASLFALVSQTNNGLVLFANGSGTTSFFATGGRQTMTVDVLGGPFNVGDGTAFVQVTCGGFTAFESQVPVRISP